MSRSESARTRVSDLAPSAGTWILDPAASTLEFTGRHFLLFPVKGSLPVQSGQAAVDADGALTHLDATVGAAGFDTGNPQRDRKVRGSGFLDAERFPVLRYVGDRIDREGGLAVSGVLVVKEREVPVVLAVDEVGVTEDQVVVRATAEVDRHACGVSAMRGMVGPRLAVRVRAVFVRRP